MAPALTAAVAAPSSPLADGPPAGGAALGEVVLASALGGGLALVLVLVVHLHRSGRTDVVQRLGDRVGRGLGTPGWVALPVALTTASLMTALLGMYWDISLHIGQGRDEGPLANPAHYLILFGLFGVFAGGVLAVCLPREERPGPAAVRVSEGWYAPVGGLLLAGAGLYALIGFPLDDVWHRLFGQDVTLWGPTHLMLIGGAGLSLVGVLVLEREGRSAAGHAGASSARVALRRVSALGGLLLGLSVFQGEFDFGVPQFRLVFHPVLLTAAAGVALVAARLLVGKGGALGAAGFYVAVHAAISLAVGSGFDEVRPDFPLYLGSALVVELLALAVRRPLVLGAVAGAGIATAGTATEYAWSQVAFRLPWGTDVLVEGLLLSLPVGVATGMTGALLALGLQGRLAEVRRPGLVFAGALVVVSAAVANGLVATVPAGSDVAVRLADAGTRDGVRWATVTAQVEVDDPSWVQVTAWQGGGLVVAPLARQADGSWASDEPVPVSGDGWKTLLRVHDGRTLAAVPVWMPADPVIDAEEVPAPASFTRPLQPEIELLQRERDLSVPAWTFGAASLVVLGCTLALVLALAWGVARVSRATAVEPRPDADTGSSPGSPAGSPDGSAPGSAAGGTGAREPVRA